MTGELEPCAACGIGKVQRAKIPKEAPSTEFDICERVHVDLRGPTDPSLGNSRYGMMITDRFSRYKWVKFMRTKGEAAQKFEEWIQDWVNPKDLKIKFVRTDNGGEFIGKDFKKILRSFAITQEFTAPRTPEQNAIVERSISLIYRNAIIN